MAASCSLNRSKNHIITIAIIFWLKEINFEQNKSQFITLVLNTCTSFIVCSFKNWFISVWTCENSRERERERERERGRVVNRSHGTYVIVYSDNERLTGWVLLKW